MKLTEHAVVLAQQNPMEMELLQLSLVGELRLKTRMDNSHQLC
jgi:hypothetical protein